MGVHEGRGQITKSLKDLLQKWGETRLAWTDMQAEAFEKEVLHPLEADVRSAVTAMEHIATVLHQVHRACD